MICTGHFHLYKVPPGENCPIHQVITKLGECYGYGNNGNGGVAAYFKDSDEYVELQPFLVLYSWFQIYSFGRPAGCYWLKGANGLLSKLFFNYVIDPTSTDPSKFVDRGGVCKAPGKGI